MHSEVLIDVYFADCCFEGKDMLFLWLGVSIYCRDIFCFFLSSIRRTEHSALKVLREQLFTHKSDLISAFQQYDKKNTGAVLLTNHRLKGHDVFDPCVCLRSCEVP